MSGELNRVEETGTEDATSMLIDITTSMLIDITISTSTDITTSTSTDITTSSSIVDVDREVTMEDSLELEEWLEDMDQNSEKKLDDDQHSSRGYLETSKASIDRHQPAEIDRQKPLHHRSTPTRHRSTWPTNYRSIPPVRGFLCRLFVSTTERWTSW
ncbi:hypothetical protein DY000_02060862 [Brassica cretica]|uniref:Uncharacterized protein n=1 Tax=Brassica cretica TaxID=69181 RepID=A0ABQ7ARR3_BRACR|nr:hypothetical protein DY000_02060862 [Brassica cretica]